MPRRLATTAICLLVACGTRPPGPVAPAGIAELRLPLDAATLDRIGEADDARGDLGRRREVLLTSTASS